jgi:hypothetical protein
MFADRCALTKRAVEQEAVPLANVDRKTIRECGNKIMKCVKRGRLEYAS